MFTLRLATLVSRSAAASRDVKVTLTTPFRSPCKWDTEDTLEGLKVGKKCHKVIWYEDGYIRNEDKGLDSFYCMASKQLYVVTTLL